VHGRLGPPAQRLGEVLRKYPVRGQRWTPRRLVQRISAAYSQGESSAALVASEVESTPTWRMMQELPAVEDLLEAADDAPIIRCSTRC
jgi:general secretion pathway protein E